MGRTRPGDVDDDDDNDYIDIWDLLWPLAKYKNVVSISKKQREELKQSKDRESESGGEARRRRVEIKGIKMQKKRESRIK